MLAPTIGKVASQPRPLPHKSKGGKASGLTKTFISRKISTQNSFNNLFQKVNDGGHHFLVLLADFLLDYPNYPRKFLELAFPKPFWFKKVS